MGIIDLDLLFETPEDRERREARRLNLLTGAEVAEQIRRAIRGEVPLRLKGKSWGDTYAGNCGFWLGDWHMVFFNDCDHLDYCAWAMAPDDRQGEFDDWDEGGQEPIELLTTEEFFQFEALLEQV